MAIEHQQQSASYEIYKASDLLESDEEKEKQEKLPDDYIPEVDESKEKENIVNKQITIANRHPG